MQGRRFKDAIHTAMSSNAFYNEKMLPAYFNTTDGKELYDSLTQEAMMSFPQYVEEIQGLADGAGLPFDKVTLLPTTLQPASGPCVVSASSHLGDSQNSAVQWGAAVCGCGMGVPVWVWHGCASAA